MDLERALASPRLAAFVERVATLRAEAPPGERSTRGRAATKGFGAELTVRLPRWFEEGRDAPEPDESGAP